MTLSDKHFSSFFRNRRQDLFARFQTKCKFRIEYDNIPELPVSGCIHLPLGKSVIFIVTLLFAGILNPTGVLAQGTDENGLPLYLNEIMASNSSAIVDEDGDAEDWIELYYAGEEPVNLEGFGLSDTYDLPFRWVFPDLTVQPGDYLLIWASGKDRNDPAGALHTNFSISAAGEEILLTNPDGGRIDEMSPVEIPTDISLGRYPDGTGEWYFFTSPTPGEANGSDGYQEILGSVNFSHQGGFYTQAFDLTLSYPDTNVTIIYTLDGSKPDPGNIEGKTYTYKNRYRQNNNHPDGELLTGTYETLAYDGDPVLVTNRTGSPNKISVISSTFHQTPFYFPPNSLFKGIVIRARAVRSGSLSGNVETHSFFVTPQGPDRYSLPVISIGIDEDSMFDYNSGFYVAGRVFDEWRDNNPFSGADGGTPGNYNQRGVEWEYPASLEIFDNTTGELILAQEMGVRVHGGWSRSDPMKSLRLYARSEYGVNRFNNQLFPDQPYNSYNRLILRNSGNDRMYTMFRDAALQKIVGHMRFDTQAYRAFVVFINGEYWGIHNLRERYDRHYLARVYGVDPDNVDYLAGNAEVEEGDSQHYIETLEYLNTHGLAEVEHYEYIQTRIDTENFMDYHIAQIFAGNTDWPGNNIDFWRYRTSEYNPDAPYGHDGRWRWLAYDMDFGFHLYSTTASHNTLAFATASNGPSYPNPPWSTIILRKLLENETFRIDFINRFADQLNSAFLPARMQSVIHSMRTPLEPEIGEHISRWQQPGSVNSWNSNIQVMNQFASDRPGHIRQHIRSFFGIGREHNLTVSISDPYAGRIHVNSIEISADTPGIEEDPWPWTGRYFGGIPIRLIAEPLPGYVFSHWDGINTETVSEAQNPVLELLLEEAVSVTAVFDIDDDAEFYPAPHSINEGPFMFSEWAADATTGSFPDHMAFVYMDEPDPGPDAGIAGFTEGEYNLESRTRINGLGTNGFAFINTGNEEGNPGYPGIRLGGAILALNTIDAGQVRVQWTGSTIRANSRVYNIRLQYRIGSNGDFQDVTDQDGNPLEYLRNSVDGHQEQLGPVILPEDVNNKPYIQLLWRYYFTGMQLDEENGQRSQMAVSEIHAEGVHSTGIDSDPGPNLPETLQLMQNYPNPFNPSTVIGYQLPEKSDVRLEVFDLLGRSVAVLADGQKQAGSHQAVFHGTSLTSGVYIYRLKISGSESGGAGNFVQTRKMVLVK